MIDLLVLTLNPAEKLRSTQNYPLAAKSSPSVVRIKPIWLKTNI
ncbi:hypothetical protein [Saccharopolyspora sp. NPDC002376]